MGLNKEIWVADIIETLERDASFLSRMSDLSEFVDNNYIHIPNAGAATQVYKNASVFPLVPAQRQDSETKIKLDQYSTQPFLVTDIETAQLSYNKRQSIMGQHARKLTEYIGDSILQSLTPTGSTRQVVIASGDKLGYKHFVALASLFNQDNVVAADRHVEIPSDMFAEMLQDEAIYKQYISGLGAVTEGGEAVVRVAGLYVHERAQVATANGQNAALAYQKDSVGKAVGTIDFMTDFGDNGKGNPLYLGGIMSAILWMGATTLRADGKGVAALVRA